MTIFWKNHTHPCIDQPCSDDAVPVIGIFTGEEDFSHIRWIGERQETALHFDDYHLEDEETDKLSTDEKVKIIVRYRDMQPESTIGRVYPGISLLSVTEGLKRLKLTNDEGKVSTEQIFLPIKTSSKFNMSSVFLTNNGFQGVLHSFLRHNDKWGQVQSFVDVALNRMRGLRKYIDDITNAFYMSTAKSAINTFLSQLNSLDPSSFNDIQSALNEVQVVLVKTLQEKMDYQYYRGEGVNEKGQLQTYFQMKEDLVAVVGFSRELFFADDKFDGRPFRTIITIYFITNEECQNRTIMKSY